MARKADKKVEVIKDFAPIPNMVIETGSILHVSNTRQQQLVKNNLVRPVGKKVKENKKEN